jgi:peptidoglycan/LPS O-acetylase OafA/YrhL
MPTILMMVEAVRPQLARIPALDGLRGLAVLAVMLFHFESRPLLPGGAFGVDLFLALSGYLITGLLLNELRESGSIDLKQFYVRRALRLMPALVLFLIGAVLISAVFGLVNLKPAPNYHQLATTVGFTAVYLLNWAFAFGYQVPQLAAHLWSLSLEEQFYVLWPGIVLCLVRVDRSMKLLIGCTLLLIIASLTTPYLVTGLSWHQSEDWRRLYYGSDFRAHGLLLGSLAAEMVASGMATRLVAGRLFGVVACASGLFFLMAALTLTEKNVLLFLTGGFGLLSISCSLLVLYAANRSEGLAILALSVAPLQYIGRRSYAIYLWHMPIGFWLSSLSPPLQVSMAIAASIAAAEISYRLVERPALRLRSRLSARAHEAPAVIAATGRRVQAEDAA